MNGTERVEELDGLAVPLPTLPEAQKPELVAPTGGEPAAEGEAADEEAYVKTLKDA